MMPPNQPVKNCFPSRRLLKNLSVFVCVGPWLKTGSLFYALLLISISEIKQQTLCVLRVSSAAGGESFTF